MAVVVSAESKLTDVPLADQTKLCKDTQKTWPDGKNFTLVMRDPESPEMHVVAQKLFGAAPGEVKARSEEHTSELQSQSNLVCRLLLEKKKTTQQHSKQEHSRLPTGCRN